MLLCIVQLSRGGGHGNKDNMTCITDVQRLLGKYLTTEVQKT